MGRDVAGQASVTCLRNDGTEPGLPRRGLLAMTGRRWIAASGTPRNDGTKMDSAPLPDESASRTPRKSQALRDVGCGGASLRGASPRQSMPFMPLYRR
jgi:hypothetical protein